MVGSAAALGGMPLPLKQMSWLTVLFFFFPSPLSVLLQNGVGGGEDADKLVRLLAAQISQGNAASVLAPRRRGCHSDRR